LLTFCRYSVQIRCCILQVWCHMPLSPPSCDSEAQRKAVPLWHRCFKLPQTCCHMLTMCPYDIYVYAQARQKVIFVLCWACTEWPKNAPIFWLAKCTRPATQEIKCIRL
jgi:hypothetical protein